MWIIGSRSGGPASSSTTRAPSSDSRLATTRVTQSVQLRVFRSIAAGTRPGEDDPSQALVEFQLNKRMLFAGERGGLRAVGADEKDFLQFLSMPFDPLPMGKVASEWTAVTLLDGSIVAVGGGACGTQMALPEVYFLPGAPAPK